MSTSTAERLSQPDSGEQALQRGSVRPLWARYVGAMLYFMGAALIAGGVVHYPIDPPQYGVSVRNVSPAANEDDLARS